MKFKSITYQRFKERVADIQEPENFALIAVAAWRTLLVFVVISALLSIAYGFSLMQDALALSAPADMVAQKSLSSNRDRKDLDAIVAIFAARKDLYAQLKTRPINVPDPSQ